MELSGARLAGLTALLGQMSDTQLQQLEEALLGAAQTGATDLFSVLDAIRAEMTDRATAARALAPLSPLLQADTLDPLAFPPAARAAFWADVRAFSPDLCREAIGLLLRLKGDDPTPPLFDRLCIEAAARLREGEGALVNALGARGPQFAEALALVPIARNALPHLSSWAGRPDSASAAIARLTLRDAVNVDADAAPLLLQILRRHLDDRSKVLRLISAVADHPGDEFLAASEFAPFGAELLNQLEGCVVEVRTAENLEAGEDGARAAASACRAAELISEFETYIQLSKKGPWGVRVAAAKRSLAQICERRTLDLEVAVGAALPLQPARVAKRFLKGVPKVHATPLPLAILKLRNAVAFVRDTRPIAATAGFGAVRLRVVERLEERLAHYVEDLLELLHDNRDHPHAPTYLELTAEVLEAFNGIEAGDVVRRRLAVALAESSEEAA